jgi:hypothetical protein
VYKASAFFPRPQESLIEMIRKRLRLGRFKAQDIGEKLHFLRIEYLQGMERERMCARMRRKEGRNRIWGFRVKVRGKIRKSRKAKILTAGILKRREGGKYKYTPTFCQGSRQMK